MLTNRSEKNATLEERMQSSWRRWTISETTGCQMWRMIRMSCRCRGVSHVLRWRRQERSREFHHNKIEKPDRWRICTPITFRKVSNKFDIVTFRNAGYVCDKRYILICTIEIIWAPESLVDYVRDEWRTGRREGWKRRDRWRGAGICNTITEKWAKQVRHRGLLNLSTLSWRDIKTNMFYKR
jgi:hypothetical protein